ncbi:protein CLP1 homolog [Nilaparvata lugens]|uniref:protein CLP1 homolog n=1 Tax=Nilaparvata lugens TaxID=108931 RepID=UPI00193E5D96|nr:protein CLP1 homolog [Nilaparvata lugens]XP_039300178.1 protein CLP1 homolog [Nilaparvata lugens]XP_039301009.1 protein CLP1 homolog [Nilaparvata lugens]
MSTPQGQNDLVEVFKTLSANEQCSFISRKESDCMTLQLQSGEAEIFGARLELNKVYSFSAGYCFSVFTYSGCNLRLQLQQSETVPFSQRNDMMMFELHLHTVVEELRERADVKDERGPIVMIVGPKDAGKSTFSTILLNYAVRMQTKRTPVFVDTDPGQSSLTLPGTIGAALISDQIQPDKKLSEQVNPLIYNIGSTRLGVNPLYKQLISKLAATVLDRLKSNKTAKSSGLIINTPGWTQNEGFEIIRHTAQAFEVDVIFVLYQKTLFDALRHGLPNFVKLVQLPRLEGVRSRSMELRWELRDKMLKDYFYGPNNELKPYIFDVDWSSIKVFKVWSSKHVGKSYLGVPEFDTSLRNKILAVTFAQNKEDALESNISGFVCLADVIDSRERKVTLLSPFPPPLADVCLLLTSLFLTSYSVPNSELPSNSI